MNSNSQASQDYKDFGVFPTTDLNSIETQANPVRKVISTTITATVTPSSISEATSSSEFVLEEKSTLKNLRNFAKTTKSKLILFKFKPFFCNFLTRGKALSLDATSTQETSQVEYVTESATHQSSNLKREPLTSSISVFETSEEPVLSFPESGTVVEVLETTPKTAENADSTTSINNEITSSTLKSKLELQSKNRDNEEQAEIILFVDHKTFAEKEGSGSELKYFAEGSADEILSTTTFDVDAKGPRQG